MLQRQNQDGKGMSKHHIALCYQIPTTSTYKAYICIYDISCYMFQQSTAIIRE